MAGTASHAGKTALLGFYGCPTRAGRNSPPPVCVGAPRELKSRHLMSMARIRYRIEKCPRCGEKHIVLPMWRQASPAEARRKAEIKLTRSMAIYKTKGRRKGAHTHPW